MILLSPAKLNLSFQVLRKRGDGYHDIASLFQAIDLFDRLFISPSDQDKITCTDPAIPCDETNLVAKAMALFPNRSRFHIHIEKKIPVQAGLGGGSSNGATVLWGINELMGRPNTLDQLVEMGAKIGSDVPFFLSLGSAFCTGRGEILEPRPFVTLTGWLAKPIFGLSTPLVYKQTRIEELPKNRNEAYFNDLEVPAFQLEPRLIQLQKKLQTFGFEHVVMTGSGTAFFCLGNGNPSPIDGVTFFPFQSIQRNPASWY